MSSAHDDHLGRLVNQPWHSIAVAVAFGALGDLAGVRVNGRPRRTPCSETTGSACPLQGGVSWFRVSCLESSPHEYPHAPVLGFVTGAAEQRSTEFPLSPH
jgi:hypothetical protein